MNTIESGDVTIQSSEEEFIIPIDDKIFDFKNHLDFNPRTIFSAKFGDGKSFFLSKMAESEIITKEYKVLTIHPVNYQVLENKDIFELIKRDILVQILVNNMVMEDYELTSSEAIYYYLKNNGLDFFEDIFKIISQLNLEASVIKPILAAVKSIKLFKSLRKQVKEIKEDNTTIDKIDKYIDEVDESNFIYEEDIYTKLIKDVIAKFKEKENKKVVLVIEDMDRLDPAHLFRIMNVFSAHAEYINKYGLQSKDLLCDNKFGFDNVVFVMCYENTKKIFHHFYGEADYGGYICKFASKGYFEYSLNVVRDEYIYSLIQKTTNIPNTLFGYMIDEIELKELTEKRTIRELVKACENVDCQIIKMPIIFSNNKKYDLHPGVLRFYIIMNRLGISRDNIIKSIMDVIENEKRNGWLMTYILGLLFYQYNGKLGQPICIGETAYYVRNINNDGTITYHTDKAYNLSEGKYMTMEEYLQNLFALIGKVKVTFNNNSSLNI